MISTDKAILFMGIIEGFEIHVSKYIEREIRNLVVSIYTTLDFLCLLMQICLEKGVLET